MTATHAAKRKAGKCRCELCCLSKQLQRLAAKCTPLEKAALDTLWTRMEEAETSLDWLKAHAQEGKPFTIEGQAYVPAPKPPRRKTTK